MKCIVAVDENWGIGKDNHLLVKIPDDLRLFKSYTEGNVVVMGRKTFESLPDKKPLVNRVNIVLTNRLDYDRDGVIVVHSKEELFKGLVDIQDDDVFVIGGASIYRLLLSYCDTAYVTKVRKEYDADVWFPNLDDNVDWICAREGEKLIHQNIVYSFDRYVNTNVLPRK